MERTSRTIKISGERLAVLWRESLMSQEAFAHAVGMKRSGFLRLMQPGEHGMFTDNFRRLAEAVQMTRDELRRRIGDPKETGAELTAHQATGRSDRWAGVSGIAQSLHKITRFHGISAGTRHERLALEQGTVKVPADFGDFAVRVDGESMTPEYPNDAVALFEGVDGQQFTFGKEYIIWFTNGECYFSRVVESDDDRDLLVLQKINKDRERFPDRTVHRREVERVALCVGGADPQVIFFVKEQMMSNLTTWLDHRRDVVGFEKWTDLAEFSGLSLKALCEVQANNSVEILNRSERRALASALRVSLRKLEQFGDGTIDRIEDDYFYDAGSKGRPRPGCDDDPSCWLPKETNPEDRGTPLIGRVRDGGKAEPDEDWQEDWGRQIPKRFGTGHDIYALEVDASGQQSCSATSQFGNSVKG